VPANRKEGLSYDDDELTGASEARAWEASPRKTPWPKTPDELDVRWERGARGWLSVRDPVTLERHVIPTKYAEGYARPSGTEPATQWMVRRAMEKLPPRRKPGP